MLTLIEVFQHGQDSFLGSTVVWLEDELAFSLRNFLVLRGGGLFSGPLGFSNLFRGMCGYSVAQSSPTLCKPKDCCPPTSSIHGILQARILQCVAMPSSKGSSQPRDQSYVSCIGRWILYHYCHLGNPYLGAAAAAKSLQSCPTLQPHRRQPTRLPHSWDSPGKNTGVGCHFLLHCMQGYLYLM